jgi:hypothetical protein
MKMTIIGAGMAGLLAANMLRSKVDSIIDRSPDVPNNHHSVLRFRSSLVGDTLGIPFRKVQVLKWVATTGNPVADTLSYARKTSGIYSMRSIADVMGQLEERFIAPPDFVDRMFRNIPKSSFSFGDDFDFRDDKIAGKPYISTIPMPDLMDQLDWPGPRPEFNSRPGFSIKFDVEACDAFASIYVPDFDTSIYRISVTGSEVIVEFVGKDSGDNSFTQARQAAQVLLGFDGDPFPQGHLATMRYAKISAIDEEVRKNFIMWASTEHNVFSLGRFATWRPGLLLDDLVKDVRVIERLADNKSAIYDHFKKG